MIYRIRIKGFKNIKDAEIYLGPFTCFAGGNGVGKSNLFDALAFLNALGNQENTLIKAAGQVRAREGDRGRNFDIANLFYRSVNSTASSIAFELDMVVSSQATDYLGQKVLVKNNFLRYELEIGNDPEKKHHPSGLVLKKESLIPIEKKEVVNVLTKMGASEAWIRDIKPAGSGKKPFIEFDPQNNQVNIRSEGKGSPPKKFNIRQLTRTLISTATSIENPTMVAVQQELRQLHILQFEPSSLQAPDLLSYAESTQISSVGGHIPSALSRMRKSDEDVLTRINNRLFELLDEKVEIEIAEDPTRDLLSISMSRNGGPFFPAKSLSDGTLRFLALSTIAEDLDFAGAICMEEPENGIHPLRIPSVINLLMDIAFDFSYPQDKEYPLRQVLINTHAPAVVSLIPEDSLLYVDQEFGSMKVRALPDTWRNDLNPKQSTIRLGDLVRYLQPLPAPQGPKKTVREAVSIQYKIEFPSGQ
jgi:predicted ATPase